MDYYQYLKEILGLEIYQRARSYAEQGRVEKMVSIGNEDREQFIAAVRGKGGTYHVRVALEPDGRLQSGECNCPYPDLCKHVGATLLSFYKIYGHDPGMEKEQEFINLEQSFSSIDTSGDIDYSLAKYGELGARLPNKQGHRDVSHLPRREKNSRFRLVFVVYYDIYQKDFFVRPANQYIKKNGDPGHLAGFKEEKLAEQPNRQELYYYNYIKKSSLGPMNMSLEKDRLWNSVEVLAELVDLHIVYEGSDSPVELGVRRAQRVQISFYVKEVRGGEASFVPVFELFVTKKKKKPDIRVSASMALLKGDKAFFLAPEAGRLLFFQESWESISLLEALIQQKGLSAADIKNVADLVEQNNYKGIGLRFPYKGLWNFAPEPSLILEFESMDWLSLRYPPPRILGAKIYFAYTKDLSEPEISEARRLGSEGKTEQGTVQQQKDEKQDKNIISFEVENEDKKPSYSITDEASGLIYVLNRSRGKERQLLHKFFDIIFPDKQDNRGKTIRRSSSLGERYHDMQDMDVHSFLLTYGMRIMEEGFAIRLPHGLVRYGGDLNILVESGIDWLNVDLAMGEERLDKLKLHWEEIENGFLRKGKSYYFLSREEIEFLKNLRHWGMEDTGELEVPLTNFAFLEDYADHLREQIKEQQAEEQQSLQSSLEIMEKLQNFSEIKKISSPATFRGKMRNYQLAGYRWLYFLYEHNLNGILADDMGLGKTIQAIALLTKLFEEDEIARVLIVAPVTTLANWEIEFGRFAPNLSVYKHVGSARLQTLEELERQIVTMVSYQTAMRDSSLLADIFYDYLIMDESQNIKNYRSRTYLTVKGLQAAHKIALTGTPIENTTMELWAQMNVLNPGLLGTERQFKSNFLTLIDRGQNPQAQKRLRRMIHPFLLRRRKEDVLKSLPPKEEIVYYCDMGERQAAVYRRYADYFRARVSGLIESKLSLGNAAMEVLNGLMRMRQAALFAGLLDDKHKNVPSAKFDALKDLVQDILYEKHKVLIFSQFVEVLTIIRNYFDEQGWNYAYLDGQTPTKRRQMAIDHFQKEEDLRIFLISLKAGGVGINLTAADYVIIFDPWWNPAVESQAVDRSHRIGQTQQVFTYRLITRDTVEEKILELQNRKRQLVNDIITGDKSFFKKLSQEEILDLFS